MSTENGEVAITQNPTDMLEQARNYLQRVQFALQETTDFEEILDIRDRGELFRQYSRQQKYGIEIQNAGAEIKIRAERRLGELLQGITKNKGQRLGGNILLPPDNTPTYAELGIQKIQASPAPGAPASSHGHATRSSLSGGQGLSGGGAGQKRAFGMPIHQRARKPQLAMRLVHQSNNEAGNV